MRWSSLAGLALGLAVALAPSRAGAQYQPAYHKVAEVNGVAALHYRDDMVHCVIFRKSGQGILNYCFDKRPTDESGAVQMYWAGKQDPGPVHLLVFIDVVMRCTIWTEDSNGMLALCIDRRPPVQP